MVLAFLWASFFGPVGWAADLTIGDLKIFGDQERTVDGVLARLSSEYRSEFTLIKESRAPGADQVSPIRPRILWFGQTAQLVVAVHGDPEGDRFHRIEAMSFEGDRFSLFTQDFDPQGLSPPVFKNRTHDRSCTRCHFSDPRPNWSHYATWPGAFAGDDDSLWKELGDAEEFDKFKASIDSKSRYRHLQNLEFGYRPDIDSSPRTWVRHNRDLTDRLSRLNAKRIARLIRSTPNFLENRATIETILEGSRYGVANREVPADFENVLKVMGFKLPYQPRNNENREMEALEHWFQSRGVSTLGWSMSFDRDGVFESDGQQSYRASGEIGVEILQSLKSLE